MWYKELNLESNPFSLEKQTELIGYEDVIDSMIYVLESGNMIFIEAPDGHGKTSLLKIAIEKYKGQGKVAYIDCNRLDDLNIERVIMKRYGFFKRLFSKTPKEMIILIDNINNLSKKNCERLKYFFDQNYVRSVVFAGIDYNSVYFTPSLKERISKVEKLPILKDEEAREIIEVIIGNNEMFSKDVVKELFSISSKNPKVFIQNCEKSAKYAVENYSRIVKQDHLNKLFNVKKVVDPVQVQHDHQHTEGLLKISSKKETYKQKLEKELAGEKKPVKKQENKEQKPKKEKKQKTKPKKEINPIATEGGAQDVAEKYY